VDSHVNQSKFSKYLNLFYSLISSVLTKNGFRLTGFLNNMLVYLQEDGNVGFIATAIFMFLCLYLVWAVTKGNVKFGIRIPFLFSLHPMK